MSTVTLTDKLFSQNMGLMFMLGAYFGDDTRKLYKVHVVLLPNGIIQMVNPENSPSDALESRELYFDDYDEKTGEYENKGSLTIKFELESIIEEFSKRFRPV